LVRTQCGKKEMADSSPSYKSRFAFGRRHEKRGGSKNEICKREGSVRPAKQEEVS